MCLHINIAGEAILRDALRILWMSNVKKSFGNEFRFIQVIKINARNTPPSRYPYKLICFCVSQVC